MRLGLFSKVVLYFSFTFQMLFVTANNVFLATIASTLLLVPFFLYIIQLKPKLIIDKNIGYYCIFIIYLVISSAWSPIAISYSEVQSSFIIVVFLIVALNILNWSNGENIIIWSFITVTFVNFIIYIGLFNIGFWGDIYGGSRFQGSFENPNGTAVNSIFTMLFLMFFISERPSRFLRFGIIIGIVCCTLIVLSTGSKKSIILLPLIWFLFFLFKNNDSTILFVIKKVSIFIAIITLAWVGWGYLEQKFFIIAIRFEELFNNIGGGGDVSGSSTAQRIYFVNKGFEIFLDKPLLGHGKGAFQYYFGMVSHNNYIETLINFGFIGFFLYYIRYYIIIKSLFSLGDKKIMPVILMVLVMLYLEIGLISFDSKMFIYAFLFLMLHVKKLKYSINDSKIDI